MQPRIAHLLPSATYLLLTPSAANYRISTILAHAGQRLEDGLVIYWTNPEEVAARLEAYKPTLCLLWEEQPCHMLRAFSGGQKWSLEDRAGYVWLAKAIAPGVKCLATYGPARLQVEAGLSGVTKFHVQKAVREASVAELVVPQRQVFWSCTKDEILRALTSLRVNRRLIAIDIEGGCGMGPACVGFADTAHVALVVPFYDVDGCSIWSEEDELILWRAVADVLEDPLVPKIIQNALYELFVLAWTTGIVVQGIADDTMLKHFELYAELEKSLEFQASIYTNQPYWKLDHKEVESRYVPFKDGRRATTEEWLIYNGTDCCVTYEVNEVMERQLKPKQREHYLFNVSLLTPFAYMSLRGLRYDKAKAEARLAETEEKIYELQDEINREAAKGRPALQEFYNALRAECPVQSQSIPCTNGSVDASCIDQTGSLVKLLTTAFCQARRTIKVQREEVSWQPYCFNGKKWVRKGKRLQDPGDWPTFEEEPDPIEYQVWAKPVRKVKEVTEQAEIKTFEDVLRYAKDSRRDACKNAVALLRSFSRRQPLPSESGQLSTLLNLHININSTAAGGDAQWYVFDHCKAPKQFKREKGASTDKLTTGNSAVLAAYIATQDPRLATFMKWRSLDTRRESLRATTDPDGRVRCSYNLAGTETYRVSCSKSVTGSGYNLQTVTEELRDLFPADEECEFGQFDLRGADGYTIAALCAQQGDTTMLLDLEAGLKPVNIIVLLYTEGVHINSLSREELKIAQKRVAKESWQYIATKPIFYGYTYLMGANKMSEGIAEDSYAETGVATVVSPKKCQEIMAMIDLRYPGIERVQADAARQMIAEGTLRTSVGWVRKFFGRKASKVKVHGEWVTKPDRTTHGAWLSTLPQFFTTYFTKLGLSRMWSDPDNRRPDNSLRVEPLHTVHDSLNPQWRVEDRAFAKAKVLPEWFNNSCLIAGQMMAIPAAGTYGKSWGEQEAL